MTADGWRLTADGWRRRRVTGYRPRWLHRAVAPVAFRDGLRWIIHHIGAVRDCGWVRDRRRDGARDIDAVALTNGGQNLTDGRKKVCRECNRVITL